MRLGSLQVPFSQSENLKGHGRGVPQLPEQAAEAGARAKSNSAPGVEMDEAFADVAEGDSVCASSLAVRFRPASWEAVIDVPNCPVDLKRRPASESVPSIKQWRT